MKWTARKRACKGFAAAGLLALVFLSGCSHPLEVKNLNSYKSMELQSLPKRVSVGIIPQANDQPSKDLVKGVARELAQYSVDVVMPYQSATSRQVDVVASLDIGSEYKGSGWNFLVNFPGFLVFAPAWNGYIYKADYDVQVSLLDREKGSQIGSFTLDFPLDLRHSEIDRTWTQVSWLEVGIIAAVGGIAFTQYDPDVTPLLGEKIERPLGDHIAREIVNRIGNYRDIQTLGVATK
jgi:hypothetical protein